MPSDFCIFFLTEKVEERMSGVHGVFNYAGCFSDAAGNVDSVIGWEVGSLVSW